MTTTVSTPAAATEVAVIPLADIRRAGNVGQELGDLESLAESIRQHGVLTVVLVERQQDGELRSLRATTESQLPLHAGDRVSHHSRPGGAEGGGTSGPRFTHATGGQPISRREHPLAGGGDRDPGGVGEDS
ncbi:MAG: hypothetical protein JF887_04745 [Candidatus Dormibacteraeota bacterium]|uniref:Uncharacterized protein n=1 Tax=Candidatus Amunia macphersoniae TaxID=3127014 RepID=A0A934NJ06_9BACT|nr:hypothetical protein [Candidatus Dormibacteraeota bacterium]